MASAIDEGSSTQRPPKSTAEKPVIVRVKRKTFQSKLDGFWLEINERPTKRPLLDFEKLSISDSAEKEEWKPKKVFVQHVETVTSSKDAIDIVQSFVPNSADASKGKTKSEERRHTFKKDRRQDQLLSKARQNQKVLVKNARFEQIWRSRKGTKEAMRDKALHEMYHFYDVVRVDVEERSNKVQMQEELSLDDQRLLSSYLPLMREFIPSAAAEIESDMRAYMSKQASADDYVYDYYTVKDDMNVDDEDASNPFPLVQVEDEDFYDGPDELEYDSEDSNAEDNPRNDYPDEISEGEEEVESKTSDESEEDENESVSGESSEHDLPEDDDMLHDGEIYSNDCNDDGDDFDFDGNEDGDGEDCRWPYR